MGTKEKKVRDPAELGNQGRTDQGTFKMREGAAEPLADPIGVRLPISYAERVKKLPSGKKTAWLRSVIVQAVDNGDLPDGY